MKYLRFMEIVFIFMHVFSHKTFIVNNLTKIAETVMMVVKELNLYNEI